MRKKYTLEDTEKIIFETDDVEELNNYINNNICHDLVMFDICETGIYTVILYVGYALWIKTKIM